jgi:hypothetical protein
MEHSATRAFIHISSSLVKLRYKITKISLRKIIQEVKRSISGGFSSRRMKTCCSISQPKTSCIATKRGNCRLWPISLSIKFLARAAQQANITYTQISDL